METKDILSRVDHTYLKVSATWEDIKKTCDEGMEFSVASVCIPPCFIKQAREYVGKRLRLCTVIGFPNGYSSTEVKRLETEEAICCGADEIDMVINVGDLKCGNYDKILDEIRTIKEACKGKILKVIIEACLLSENEKIKMCELVTLGGADYIKTSTGFSTGGATREDVALFKKYIGKDVKIKAAGGISSLEDAIDFINLGASRLGTSRIVNILKKDGGNNGNSTY